MGSRNNRRKIARLGRLYCQSGRKSGIADAVREGNLDFVRCVTVHFGKRKQTVCKGDATAVCQFGRAFLIFNVERRLNAVNNHDSLFGVCRQVLGGIVGNADLERIVFEEGFVRLELRLIQNRRGAAQNVVFLLIQKDFNVVGGSQRAVEREFCHALFEFLDCPFVCSRHAIANGIRRQTGVRPENGNLLAVDGDNRFVDLVQSDLLDFTVLGIRIIPRPVGFDANVVRRSRNA